MQVPIDQNFPEPIVDALSPQIPDIDFLPVRKINPSLAEAGDRELLLTLHNLKYTWFVTLNYKMLRNPVELAAILKTKINVFAIEGLGHDPIRSTGALLLHINPAIKSIQNSGRNGVFWIRTSQPRIYDAWDLLSDAAEKLNQSVESLYLDVKVSNDELASY